MDLVENLKLQLSVERKDFFIPFNDVWQLMGYKERAIALEELRIGLDKEIDYLQFGNDGILLSINGFKMFCMMADTPQGTIARRYFIDQEKELIRRWKQISNN